MRGPFQPMTSPLRSLFKNVKGENRLILNFTGLFIIIVFHLFASIGIFFYAHSLITKTDSQLETDLKHTYSLKNDLAVLSFERSFTVQDLKRLVDTSGSISKGIKAEHSWQLVEVGLSNLVKAGSAGGRENIEKISAELKKSSVLVDNLIVSLIEKRQTFSNQILSQAFIIETGLVLLTIILVCIGTIPLFGSLKKRNNELSYFQSIAYQFKSGQLDKIKFSCPGDYLADLNEALSKYILLLKERYQSVKDHIKNLNFDANEIALFSKQSDTFYLEIKQSFEQLVSHTYDQVGKYQVLAERIKSLNENLDDSQQQILILHESLKDWAKIFKEAPETIRTIGIQVQTREQYLKKIVGDLYQLRSTLDLLLQTGSVFQSVAEQNTLLALNASIEAARAETASGGFNIAAEEITRLAEKIGGVSKELLTIVDTMGVKGKTALKILENDLARNNDVKHFIEAVGNKINSFCQKIDLLLIEAIQYSTKMEEFQEKRKSLEELVVTLGALNEQSQNNYGRAEAAIEVIRKSGETTDPTEQLSLLISELKQLMNKIVV